MALQEVYSKCLWRFAEVTQTNQLLKGVKGEFSTLGNKHTHRLSHCQRICMSELVLSFSHCKVCIKLFPTFWAFAMQDYASPWTANFNHQILQPFRLIVMHTKTHIQGIPTNTVTLFSFQRAVSCKGICVLPIYQSDSRRQGYRGSNITTYSLMAYLATDHYPSQHSTAQHYTTQHCAAQHHAAHQPPQSQHYTGLTAVSSV